MRTNWHTVLWSDRMVLVPYRRRHVLRYHDWMQCGRLRHLTASEPLSLDEESAMQRSWRRDPKKCTFIVLDRVKLERALLESHCVTRPDVSVKNANPVVSVSKIDSEIECACRLCSSDADVSPRHTFSSSARNDAVDTDSDSQSEGETECAEVEQCAMIGDVNLFLQTAPQTDCACRVSAEVEVMVAETWARGRGLGRRAVIALLRYAVEQLNIRHFCAKIGAANAVSRRLFETLWFRQTEFSAVFDEVTLELCFGKTADHTRSDWSSWLETCGSLCHGYYVGSCDNGKLSMPQPT